MNNSNKAANWKITSNTDTVDIDQKCIGLSPRRDSIPSDVAEHIHSNRGLHIQIRHNRDSQTVAQANDLARLIAAAPELLEALEGLHKAFKRLAEKYEPDSTDNEWLIYSSEALAKARGES